MGLQGYTEFSLEDGCGLMETGKRRKVELMSCLENFLQVYVFTYHGLLNETIL